MRSLMFAGLVTAALVLGSASRAQAQFSLSMGNAFTGQGLAIGATPYGYGPGYGGFGGINNTYSSGYSGLGYGPVYGVNGYVNPGYVYPSYGIRNPAFGYGPRFRRPYRNYGFGRYGY